MEKYYTEPGLLQQCYEQYKQTGNRKLVLTARNGDEMGSIIASIRNLETDKLVDSVSPNVHQDTISITEPGALTFAFSITDLGIQECEKETQP